MNTWKAPLSLTKKVVDLIILIDRCGIEMYTDNGKMYMSWLSEETVSDRTQPMLTLNASQEMCLERVELHELESIWKNEMRYDMMHG